jgi:hypothetical protein
MKPARLAYVVLLVAAASAHAAGDPAVGRLLVQAKGCEACHDRQPLQGAKAIYVRKNRIVGSMAELEKQVSSCNDGLGLGLTPAEERDVVAYLNDSYYRFGK